MEKKINLLAVSGSLRAQSLNLKFIKTMSLVCPNTIKMHMYKDLDKLPLFNADYGEQPIEIIKQWRSAIKKADMVLISTPEYAHGVTGVIKNALDWVVGSAELVDKPIAFPNISTRATIAYSQLSKTLMIMGGSIIESCSPTATLESPLVDIYKSEKEIIEDRCIRKRLEKLWIEIEIALRNK